MTALFSEPLVQIVHVSDVGLAARDGVIVTPTASDREDFARFVRQITLHDAKWKDRPAWFVASHVVATDESVSREHLVDVLDAIAPRSIFAARIALPSPGQRQSPDRDPIRWPVDPVTARSLDDRTEIQLYGMDTHDGAIEPDELVRLATLAALHCPDKKTRVVRIVASHHPIAALVGEPARTVSGPLAQLNIAAHTFRAEPSAPRANRPTFITPGRFSLGRNDAQGTASVIRIYSDSDRPGVVVCERRVAARAAGSHAWDFRSDAGGSLALEWPLACC